MGDLRKKIEVGDRVTYDFDGEIMTRIIFDSSEIFVPESKILKIERPTYEVVAEVNEEEKNKELLTEGEKKLLSVMINNINSWNCEKVHTISIVKNCDDDITDVNFYGPNMFLGRISACLHFDNLKQGEYYTIEDLNLELIYE